VAILTEDMKRVVHEQVLGFVATVCPDGSPNLSPKGTTSVWDDDHLIFADLASPATMANLVLNQAVEVNVVDPILRKGYRFKGRAQVYTEGPIFKQAVGFYKHLEASRIHGVAIIAVERAERLISPAYDSGATEAQIADRFARRLEEFHGWTIQPRAKTDTNG
jgi:predicted pyridoxine 5'-phosphate oxidase superfamily flavin-nucleotide-binding protein